MGSLGELPDYFKKNLRIFLENAEQVRILEEQLIMTPVIIHDGKYQLSIDSVEELHQLVRSLKTRITTDC